MTFASQPAQRIEIAGCPDKLRISMLRKKEITIYPGNRRYLCTCPLDEPNTFSTGNTEAV
jgi:hypothetical protein